MNASIGICRTKNGRQWNFYNIMALISVTWCNHCRKETHHTNRKCNDCYAREKREEAAIWHSKTNEEKIEALLRRIEKLENANQRLY